MKINIENKNFLLKRKEVVVVGSYNVNPGFVKVKEDIAKKFDASQEVIVVKGIHGNFGSHEFLIDAFIYDSVKDMEMVEPKKKVKKVAGEIAVVPAGGKK